MVGMFQAIRFLHCIICVRRLFIHGSLSFFLFVFILRVFYLAGNTPTPGASPLEWKLVRYTLYAGDLHDIIDIRVNIALTLQPRSPWGKNKGQASSSAWTLFSSLHGWLMGNLRESLCPIRFPFMTISGMKFYFIVSWCSVVQHHLNAFNSAQCDLYS